MSIFKSITSLSISKSGSKCSIVSQSNGSFGSQGSNQISGGGGIAGSKKAGGGVYYHHEESSSSTTFIGGGGYENSQVSGWRF
ncbi:hypothetical protein RB653_006666 [Dictyostelium firmibasis]|uniref:Uncharacterized protein n=1 Tax=Dictyostelium firmibasis TaxID=79012 RepID=A0AAN7TU95_9MYCE